MEKVYRLRARSSPQIKELRYVEDTEDGALYEVYAKWPGHPDLDNYLLISYKEREDGLLDIYSVDFDGGPFLCAGYKLDDNTVIDRILPQGKLDTSNPKMILKEI